MDYGTPSRARLVASIVNRKRQTQNGMTAWAVYRNFKFTVVWANIAPSDIV